MVTTQKGDKFSLSYKILQLTSICNKMTKKYTDMKSEMSLNESATDLI